MPVQQTLSTPYNSLTEPEKNTHYTLTIQFDQAASCPSCEKSSAKSPSVTEFSELPLGFGELRESLEFRVHTPR